MAPLTAFQDSDTWLLPAVGVRPVGAAGAEAGTTCRNALVMLDVTAENTRFAVALACGTTWSLLFSTPTRTAPFWALTACPSASGQAVAAALADVMTSGEVGQNASAPSDVTVRTCTRSPTVSVRAVSVSAPRSLHWDPPAGEWVICRASLFVAPPPVTVSVTETMVTASGSSIVSVVWAAFGLVIE